MEYRHQGHHLPQKEYTILTENWLPKLTNYLGDYKYRQSRATERYRHVIRDPNVVRDFPVDVLKAMATDSTQPTRGPWTVSLHPYIHKQVRVTKKLSGTHRYHSACPDSFVLCTIGSCKWSI